MAEAGEREKDFNEASSGQHKRRKTRNWWTKVQLIIRNHTKARETEKTDEMLIDQTRMLNNLCVLFLKFKRRRRRRLEFLNLEPEKGEIIRIIN